MCALKKYYSVRNAVFLCFGQYLAAVVEIRNHGKTKAPMRPGSISFFIFTDYEVYILVVELPQKNPVYFNSMCGFLRANIKC